MSDDLFGDILEDVEENQEANKESRVKTLSTHLIALKEAQEVLKKAEEKVAEAKEKVKHFSEQVIPDFFDNLQISEMKMSDGSKVSIKTTYACGITKKNETQAFSWLRSHGLADIIKNKVEIEKKGESFSGLVEYLNEKAIAYKQSEKVHPSTLKAVVTEQIESGADFPKDVFSVFPLRKTIIK